MNLTYPEVSVILGVCSIIGGVLIKIFFKPDSKFNSRLDILEYDLKNKNIELIKDFEHKYEMTSNTLQVLSEKLKTFNDDMTHSIESIDLLRNKDLDFHQKNFDKLECKLEKLNDLLVKIIQQIKHE